MKASITLIVFLMFLWSCKDHKNAEQGACDCNCEGTGYQEKTIDTGTKPVDTPKVKNGLVLDDGGLTEYYYKNGKKNGVFKNYFKRNRKLHVLGFYKDDKPVDTWYFFNQEGGMYLIEYVKGRNINKQVRSRDGKMVKPPFMSYRKEFNSETGQLKREGLALFYEDVEKGFYRYGTWKEYDEFPDKSNNKRE